MDVAIDLHAWIGKELTPTVCLLANALIFKSCGVTHRPRVGASLNSRQRQPSFIFEIHL
jgi:hypothetical protein